MVMPLRSLIHMFQSRRLNNYHLPRSWHVVCLLIRAPLPVPLPVHVIHLHCVSRSWTRLVLMTWRWQFVQMMPD